MRSFGRWLGRGLIFLFLLFLGLWAVLPTDTVDRGIAFDASTLPDDLEAWLATEEQQFSDITAGTAKRIHWAGALGEKTPLAVIYLHGFSATSQEIQPVPAQVAQVLGANVFYTRLAGHGRGGVALAGATAGDWIEDTAEALAIGRRLGDRVLILATSTGGTLAAIAATDPQLAQDLAGVVLISPNFGVRPLAGKILDLPLARTWGPWLAGAEFSFAPANADQARYWTTSYPTAALFPMAALVRHARELDFGAAKTPALFVVAAADQVVDPARTEAVIAAWGGPVQVARPVLGPGDDRYSHVIAGDILSPGQTAATVALIVAWAKGL